MIQHTLMLSTLVLTSLPAMAQDNLLGVIDEIPGQRVHIENSGRKYASCYGRDAATTERSETEVSEIVVSGDYLRTLLNDHNTIYGLAIRGYMGHSTELSIGERVDDEGAMSAAEYKVGITISFADRTFAANITPELSCTIEGEDGITEIVSHGAFAMDEAGLAKCASNDVFFTITSLDSMFQALDLYDELPDLYVTVSSSFEATYGCMGSKDSLAIGRSEVHTPYLSIFDMSLGVCE